MTVARPSADVFVSGRLCLFGEHSDWAGEHGITPGRCIVVGTQEGLHAHVTRLAQQVLRVTAHDHKGHQVGPWEVPLEPKTLLAEARKGGFWSYIAGTAYRICLNHSINGGLEIVNHTTTLPLSKGLSSSAAVCVLMARSFNLMFDLQLSVRGEMEFAYLGEVTTPSKCGRMDQGCAYGSVPIAMTFDRDIMEVDRVNLAAPLHLVLVDLGAEKCTTTILTSLQAHYPTPRGPQGEQLHHLLGGFNLGVTSRALTVMAAGNLAELGSLMARAQAEFDAVAGAVCPEQLTAPVLHRVLAHPNLQGLVWGGKGVGSQGDGTAQFLCKGEAAQQQVCSILQRDFGMHCLPLTVLPTAGSGGKQQQQQEGRQQQCSRPVQPMQQQQEQQHHQQPQQQDCSSLPNVAGVQVQQQQQQLQQPWPNLAVLGGSAGAVQSDVTMIISGLEELEVKHNPAPLSAASGSGVQH